MSEDTPTRGPGAGPATSHPAQAAAGAPTVVAPTAISASHESPGARIGPYRLLEQIGEGGFGSVFLAEQDKPVRRRVALKIIKLGMDTRQVVARFEQERQALAVMDHPNIAKVFDAGATESGRPYFVMELVQGEPITRYCDVAQLSIRERLDLFVQVCHAVQHAHQKGVIHRDIKPSNILVSATDGKPFAKVIDFGIAKATAARLTEKTLFTEHRTLIGTPEYMSPEQAEGSMDIDTRTDVYALGVLLYELFTGSTPFDSARLRSAAYGEIQRIIREVAPPKPSTRLSQSVDTLPSVAARRRTEPRRLSAIVRGDLDWIVMKALEKDRTRRYDTANGFAADILRHLAGEAVIAAPPSAAYQVRTFVRRHRGPVAAAALVALALVLGVIGTGAGLVRADAARLREMRQREAAETAQGGAERAALEEKRQREEAESARDAERRARRQADSMNEFIQTALISSDPNQGGRQNMLVNDAMRKAVGSLDAGAFREDPETELGLRLTIANVLSGNSRADEGLVLAQNALIVAQRLHPTDHPTLAAAMFQVARAHTAAGRSDLAEPIVRDVLEMDRRLYPGDHAETARAIKGLAGALANQWRYAEAEPFFREAVEMRRRLYPGDDRHLAQSMNDYGYILQSLGRSAEAEPLFAESLEMRRRLHVGDHPDIAESLNNLAWSLDQAGRAVDAEPHHRESLDMYRRLFAGDHSWTSRGLYNLAANLCEQKGYAEAAPLFSEAAGMSQRMHPGDYRDTCERWCLAGVCETLSGDTEAGERHIAAAQEMYDRLAVPNQAWPARSSVTSVMTVSWLRQKVRFDPAAANEVSAANLEAARRRFAPGSERLGSELAARGFLLGGIKTIEAQAEAEALLREALRIGEAAAPGHPSLMMTNHSLAGALTIQAQLNVDGDKEARIGKLREAESLFLAIDEAGARGAIPQVYKAGFRATLAAWMTRLYTVWETLDPGAGKAEKAEQWRAKAEPARAG